MHGVSTLIYFAITCQAEKQTERKDAPPKTTAAEGRVAEVTAQVFFVFRHFFFQFAALSCQPCVGQAYFLASFGL